MSGALLRLSHVLLAVAFVRTPELDAAVRSIIVLRFRMLELGIVAAVFVLMVLKPF